MNVYQDTQTSGNDWTVPTQPTLRDFLRVASTPNGFENGQSDLSDLEEQMAEFEAHHQESIREVQKLYVLPSNSAVKEFLDGHRTIPQLLIQAAPRLREHFGETTVFSLRVVVDEYGWQKLYALIIWPGKVGDVAAALDRFEDGWWIANSNPASGSLTFTYELV